MNIRMHQFIKNYVEEHGRQPDFRQQMSHMRDTANQLQETATEPDVITLFQNIAKSAQAALDIQEAAQDVPE